MTATPEDLQAVAGLIEKLDIPGRQGGGEKAAPQSAENTVAKLRELAETALKISQMYGANSPQLEKVGKQVDSLGTEVSNWIDRLAKDGNLPEAAKLKSELDQVKELLAPLAKEVQGNRPPEQAK